jgi:hypothetical protein
MPLYHDGNFQLLSDVHLRCYATETMQFEPKEDGKGVCVYHHVGVVPSNLRQAHNYPQLEISSWVTTNLTSALRQEYHTSFVNRMESWNANKLHSGIEHLHRFQDGIPLTWFIPIPSHYHGNIDVSHTFVLKSQSENIHAAYVFGNQKPQEPIEDILKQMSIPNEPCAVQASDQNVNIVNDSCYRPMPPTIQNMNDNKNHKQKKSVARKKANKDESEQAPLGGIVNDQHCYINIESISASTIRFHVMVWNRSPIDYACRDWLIKCLSRNVLS